MDVEKIAKRSHFVSSKLNSKLKKLLVTKRPLNERMDRQNFLLSRLEQLLSCNAMQSYAFLS